MDIIIATKDQLVEPGSKIKADAICKSLEHVKEGVKYLHWSKGRADSEVPGEEVLVTGLYYRIGKWRQYDLGSGYAIKAKLTPGGAIIPELRTARGKEASIIKDKNGIAINQYWPIIVEVPQEEIPEELNEASTKLIDEALEASMSIGIEEFFDLDQYEESMLQDTDEAAHSLP